MEGCGADSDGGLHEFRRMYKTWAHGIISHVTSTVVQSPKYVNDSYRYTSLNCCIQYFYYRLDHRPTRKKSLNLPYENQVLKCISRIRNHKCMFIPILIVTRLFPWGIMRYFNELSVIYNHCSFRAVKFRPEGFCRFCIKKLESGRKIMNN